MEVCVSSKRKILGKHMAELAGHHCLPLIKFKEHQAATGEGRQSERNTTQKSKEKEKKKGKKRARRGRAPGEEGHHRPLHHLHTTSATTQDRRRRRRAAAPSPEPGVPEPPQDEGRRS